MKPTGQHETPKKSKRAPAPLRDLKGNDKQQPPTVTIGKPVDEIFSFLRDFTHLSKVVRGVKSIKKAAGTNYTWEAELPVVGLISWETEVHASPSEKTITWKVGGDGALKQSGTLYLTEAPQHLCTVVTLKISYESPTGKLAALADGAFGSTLWKEASLNLRRLKCFLETGVIATVDGQPSGREEKITH